MYANRGILTLNCSGIYAYPGSPYTWSLAYPYVS